MEGRGKTGETRVAGHGEFTCMSEYIKTTEREREDSEGKKRRREKLEGKVRGNRQMEFTYIIRFTRGRKTFVAKAASLVGDRREGGKSLYNAATKWTHQDSLR